MEEKQVFLLEPHGNEIAEFKKMRKEIARIVQEQFVFFPFIWALLPKTDIAQTSKEFSKKLKHDFSLIKIAKPIIENHFLYCPLIFIDNNNQENYLYHQKPLSFGNFPNLPATCGIILGYNKVINKQEIFLEKTPNIQFKVGKILETTIFGEAEKNNFFIEKQTENWFKLH